jgi:prevent-host-death family protein
VNAIRAHDFDQTYSVTEASRRGIAGLIAEAEEGRTIVVRRHNRPVAAIVSTERLHEIDETQDDLRDLALVLARQATDTGNRTSVDNVLAAFGHTRDSLDDVPD